MPCRQSREMRFKAALALLEAGKSEALIFTKAQGLVVGRVSTFLEATDCASLLAAVNLVRHRCAADAPS